MTTPHRPFGRSFGRHISAIQPYTPSDTAPTDQHLDTLRQAPAQLRQTMIEHRNALTEARRQAEADPNLTREGKQARAAQLAQPIQQRTTAAVDHLHQSARNAYDTLQQRSTAALPQPADGVEGMLARQAAWSRAQTLLNAGMSPQQVIDEAADPETLHALTEELPTQLRAQGLHPDNAGQVVDAVHDRLAEITGNTAANARLAAREADVHMAGLEPLLTAARGEAAGQPGSNGMHGANGLSAAIAAQQARARIAAGLQLPTDEPNPPTDRTLASAVTRARQEPTRLRHAITDQMRRAAGRPHAPTDAPNGGLDPRAIG